MTTDYSEFGVEPGDDYYLASLRQAIVNRPYLFAKYGRKSLDGHADCRCGGDCQRCQEDSLHKSLGRRNDSLARMDAKLDAAVCQLISQDLLVLDKQHTQALLSKNQSKVSAIAAERSRLQAELCRLCGICDMR